MTAGLVVMLLSATAALFLAVRGLQSRGLSFENKAVMAVVWIAIITALAFILGRFAA
ncbi:hypothetical protein WG901_04975 [Novosphingobium sp. PS1R-30]|uniref:Uncharacterized protein n=1 Tax=Novosphingobium anseongense TaxID=3133436 RepID=A0ABU8RSB3_9SPHN